MTADESHTDVLIIGAGPAGLMLATWLAKCGISYRIVDKRNTKIFNGQADGLQCRTLEIFDSLGFGHRAWRESNHMLEICLWNPDADGIIRRSDRIPDTIPGISRFQQVVLHQGRIERFFLDMMAECGGNTVERGIMPTKLDIDESLVEDQDAYPITVTLTHLSEKEATPQQSSTSANGAAIQDGLFRSNLSADDTADLLASATLDNKANTSEVVKAKYMLGADGARSWVRDQLGLKLEGDSTDYIWGVLDIIPITDFPDIRMRCAIHSADSGSVMVIPRENKLVRLYIQLTTTEKSGESAGARADRSAINPEVILQAAQRIMRPYSIEYRVLDWWTAYQIGQRVGTSFSAHERVFLAGDAVHTHSPKAGQGMNVSMQDSFNLGWKIAHCVKGLSSRSILKTYQSERRRIAQDLIDFDHKFSRLFSGRPAKDVMDAEGISMDEFKVAFEKGNMFASGIAVNYGSSTIVAKSGSDADQGDGTDVSAPKPNRVLSTQDLASNLQVGMRFPSAKVLNQSDARPWDTQELLPSNGRWRVVAFCGDIRQSAQASALAEAGKAIASPKSFVNRFTPSESPPDSVFEILAIHAAPRREITIFSFPACFRHFDAVNGYDYSKIYVDDESYHEGHGKCYDTFGIDAGEQGGCVVVIRPDGYIAFVGSMGDVVEGKVDLFFEGFMIEQSGKGPMEADAGSQGPRDRNGDDSIRDGHGKGDSSEMSEANGTVPAGQAGDVLPA